MWLRCGLWITLVFFTGSLHGQTVQTLPSDRTVKEGSPVTMECGVTGGTPGSFQWLGYSVDAQDPQTGDSIFQVPPRAQEPSDPAKYEIEGTYNLKIKEASLMDGGYYTCRLNNDIHAANLVVVEEPVVDVKAELIHGNEVTITCSVQYTGPPAVDLVVAQRPTLVMMLGNREMITQAVDNPRQPTDQKFTRLEVETKYTVSGDHHREELKCHVRTQEPNFDEGITQMLNIKFGPTNISFVPLKDEYYPGDRIKCGAEGNPPPSYQWISIDSPGARNIVGDTLEILENMVGDNTWRCVVSISGQQPVPRDFNFFVAPKSSEPGGDGEEGESTSGGTSPGLIAVAIIIPVIIIIVVILILLYCCWYKRRSPKYTGGDEAPMGDKPVYDNRAATGDHPQDAGLPPQQRPSRPSPNAKYENTPNNNVPNKGQPVSNNPNPDPRLDLPVRSGRDSPGYADLGVHQIRASNPELNLDVSFDQSAGEGDRSFSIKPDAGYNNQMYQPDGGRGAPPRQQPQPQARYQTNTEV